MKKNMLIKGIVVGIILLFLGASVVTGTNVEMKNDDNNKNIFRNLDRDTLTFYPTDDADIWHYRPDYNRGSAQGMTTQNEYGGGGSSGWGCDGLLRFDILSIPPDTEIESAILLLYYYDWDMNNPAGRDINLYRITSDWDEMTVTWNTQPSYVPQPTTYSTVPSSTGVWMEWDATNDVQDFISGNEIDYGWKITDDTYWGNYNIPQTRWRTKEYGNYIPYLEIHINGAPAAPTIIGPTNGEAGESYEYTFIAFDPEDEDIYYYIDWGDETNTGWIGPYESGEQIILSYTWTSQGTYEIKAKAKDINDAESDWAYLEVTMPMSYNSLFLRFLERFPHAFPILRHLLWL